MNNPLILLDEIDKLSFSSHGDPASALLEVLDPEQNHSFVDHYLDVPFDLSHVFFMATANRIDTIPAPLKDRMEIIKLSSYTLDEKINIGKKFIIPQTLEENGLEPDDLIFEDNLLELVIEHYTRESGVRELKRTISSICRRAAYEIVKGATKPLLIENSQIQKYLGPYKYLETQKLRDWTPGLVTGLAWTPVGGDILYLECLLIPGSGKLKLTGQLGDVMKESAEIALSLNKSFLKKVGHDFNYGKHDIHLHVPAGAIPKDGPSAGVALFTAITSLITNKKVPQDLAMTGEITLSGSVLPVGGIKEKVIAAHRYKIKKILLPKYNHKDLEDISKNIKEDLEFILIDSVDEILKTIFDFEF